ncbi:hypothetical protein AC578_2755 [Pseudocercospora eumusae]|uniref:Uncharacterized protein n=1 Tax=Pseudocercospora eumusae TaxID=321146 RepID=A0A139HGX8_9PEZI|nr:hypothetical protein AC578_2755 [Pseudocercospora eumusae]
MHVDSPARAWLVAGTSGLVMMGLGELGEMPEHGRDWLGYNAHASQAFLYSSTRAQSVQHDWPLGGRDKASERSERAPLKTPISSFYLTQIAAVYV